MRPQKLSRILTGRSGEIQTSDYELRGIKFIRASKENGDRCLAGIGL